MACNSQVRLAVSAEFHQDKRINFSKAVHTVVSFICKVPLRSAPFAEVEVATGELHKPIVSLGRFVAGMAFVNRLTFICLLFNLTNLLGHFV